MTWSPAVKQLAIKSQGRPAAFADGPEWTDVVYLPANSAETYNLTTLRTNANLQAGDPVFIIFAADGPFWIHYHGEVDPAAIPGASSQGSSDGAAPDFNPSQGYFNGNSTQFSLIAPATTRVVLKVYKT
jgi:hypothetical protein